MLFNLRDDDDGARLGGRHDHNQCSAMINPYAGVVFHSYSPYKPDARREYAPLRRSAALGQHLSMGFVRSSTCEAE